NSLGEAGLNEGTFITEGNGQAIPLRETLKFSQGTSQLVQKNKDDANRSGEVGKDPNAQIIETKGRIKEETNTSNSVTRINPLFGQLQPVREGNLLSRLKNQPANKSLASEANNGNISNEATLSQETLTATSVAIGQTGTTVNVEKVMPTNNGKMFGETNVVQSDSQSKHKKAMPANQTIALDTVKLINPLLYQSPAQTAEKSADAINAINQDAIIANGIQATSAVIIDGAGAKLGHAANQEQLINPFHYNTFLGRADNQTKSSSQAVKLAEAATKGQDSLLPLNSIKSLVSSVVDKLNTAAKKEEKPNTMLAKMVNPLMVGSIKNTNDVKPTRMENIKPLVEKNETDAKTIVVGQMQTVVSTKQEPLVLLTASGNPVSAHQLREQLEKVLVNGKFVNNGDNQTFTLRLAPDHLGSIKIEIYQNEGNISAKILTASQEAKDILESHLTSIKHSLGPQNAVVDKLDIAYTPSQQDKTTKDNQQQQQQQQQKEEQSSQQKEQEKQRKTFLEELLNME
ncbi:flagellar hook-length control protein FliK, partial [Niallia nealsonii]